MDEIESLWLKLLLLFFFYNKSMFNLLNYIRYGRHYIVRFVKSVYLNWLRLQKYLDIKEMEPEKEDEKKSKNISEAEPIVQRFSSLQIQNGLSCFDGITGKVSIIFNLSSQ